MATITVTIAPELYARLAIEAAELGITVEEHAANIVNQQVQQQLTPENDA